ncbi:MAG: DUF2157 domain-containing protein [Bacillota bacterium]
MSEQIWLKKEADIWVNKGIISRDQADLILGLYPEDNKNRLITVLLVLGAILVGAGIILFFASNWEYIPRWGKVSIIIGVVILFHLSSHLLHTKYPLVSSTLLLLGCIAYGSGIWLIAQIFHINSHFPNGLLLWLAGVLPVALLFREQLPLALSAILLGLWVLAEHSFSAGVILTGAISFGIIFYLTYRLKFAFSLAVSLISAAIFIVTEVFLAIDSGYDISRPEFIIPAIILLTGQLIAVLAGNPVNTIKHFPLVYGTVGLIATGVSLYIMSFEYFSKWYKVFYEKGDGLIPLWAIFTMALGFGLLLSSRQGAGFKKGVLENLTWLGTTAAVFVALLIPVSKDGLMIMLNLLMFFWALSVIYSGYRIQNPVFFTLGIMAFLLFTVTEYFNFFWEMLPKSMFFIIGGIVLIVGGWLLERQRRRLVATWTSGKGSDGR